jgi:hypothetical protein
MRFIRGYIGVIGLTIAVGLLGTGIGYSDAIDQPNSGQNFGENHSAGERSPTVTQGVVRTYHDETPNPTPRVHRHRRVKKQPTPNNTPVIGVTGKPTVTFTPTGISATNGPAPDPDNSLR